MFLSHTSELDAGYKKPLSQFKNQKILINRQGEFLLGNNICPHQNSLIISEITKSIVCQYHGWSWDDNGNAVGSGNTNICNNSTINLQKTYIENNLIFSNKISLSEINQVDLSHLKLVEQRTDIVKSNYKKIIDVFLDVDHIPVVHRNVYDMIGIGNEVEVSWKYHDWGNIQIVEKSTNYSDEFLSTLKGDENLAAFWLTVYPYSMIEWQPGALFVTVCVPTSEDETNVLVSKYRDTRYNELNWKINSEMWETAWSQDRHQSESLYNFCTFEPHLEPAKKHFRNWLSKSHHAS
jgi:phenylpropionate dioxygenase-like ring-hydroxylating dioxygenase large terminal subunit